MDRSKALQLLELLEEKKRRTSRRKIDSYFPDSGPLRRELYVKHVQFFESGTSHRERLFLAANRVGKTESVGAYEVSCHATGQYPKWWQGRRFTKPIRCWVAGDTSKTVREILQAKLLGPIGSWGTGVIPGDSIERTTRQTGTADTIDTVYVKHVAGGVSQIVFKSYDQRRESFQGTEQDVIWLDEEPPQDIYTECLLRTMATGGFKGGTVLLTFTPLLGLSEVVLSFLPGGKLEENSSGSKFVVMATWDDAPHLSQSEKNELYASIPPFQRDARSKGIPQLGAGAIYPVPESSLLVEPFPIPEHWPRGFGMDVGWNFTAAVWGALNRESGTLYLYHGYKRGQVEPDVHASSIQAPGKWIPGFIDPASQGSSQRDGTQLLQEYRNLGLNLEPANNAVEAGIFACWQLMVSGKLKVFRGMDQWLEEFRIYRRDEKGKIVKANDHLMDATRYLESRLDGLKTRPVEHPMFYQGGTHFGESGWMA